MIGYNDLQWVENFQMLKDGVKQLTNILGPRMCRKDTNYRKANPMLVRIDVAVYKLMQGASLLHKSEMFKGWQKYNILHH